jgi:hypothetical protein
MKALTKLLLHSKSSTGFDSKRHDGLVVLDFGVPQPHNCIHIATLDVG